MRFLRGLGLVAGVILLILGVAVAGYVGPDNQVNLPAHRVGSASTPLIASQPEFFGYDGTTIRVRAQAPGGVFVGAAPDRDIIGYTNGVRHLSLNGFSISGALSGTTAKGERRAPDPKAAGIWSEQASGTGEQHIDLELTDRSFGFVVQPTKPGSGTTVGLGIQLAGVFLAALAVAVIGLLLLVAMLLLGRRARDRRDDDRRDPETRPRSGSMAGPGAESGASAPRTALSLALPTALALGLALGLSGCFGMPSTVSGPRPAPAALPDRAAVTAMLADYDRRNNAAIKQASNPPYRSSAWTSSDSGAMLEIDRYASAVARVKHTTLGPLRHRLQRAYVPATNRYPLFTVAAVKVEVAKSGKSLGTRLQVMRRASTDQPWVMESVVSVPASKLPEEAPISTATAASKAQLARAGELSRSLRGYWKNEKEPAAGLVAALSAPVKEARALRKAGVKSSQVTSTPYGGHALRVVRVKGGALAVATYQVSVISVAKPGTSLSFRGLAGKVRGTALLPSLNERFVAVAAWLIPDRGDPKLIGGSIDPALS